MPILAISNAKHNQTGLQK